MSERSISSRRQLLFAVVATGLLLFVLEAALRGGGALYLRLNRPEAASSEELDGSLHVWSFGDSYTLGVGAGDPGTESYPAVATRLLGEALGREVRLFNHARPGQNSTDTVRSLEAALASAAQPPDLVLLLAGVNNIRWLGQSGQFCLDEPGGVGLRLPLWLVDLRVYKVLRHGVLVLRGPRAEDRACLAISEGFGFLDEGLPDRAEAAFERALASNPSSRWARLGEGVSLLRVGRHEEAAAALGEAQSLGLSPPAGKIALGFSLRAQGLGDAALAAVAAERSGELEEFALLLKGWVLYDQGAFGEALQVFEALSPSAMAGGVAPGAVMVYGLDGQGWTLRALGRSEAAAAAFTEANRLGGEMFVTPQLLGWSHLGRALIAAEAGDSEAALSDVGAAVRDSSAAAASLALQGWILGAEICAAAAPHFAKSLGILPWQKQALAGQQLCAELGSEGQLPAWVEVAEFPTWRPEVTVSVQQWLDPGDTRLVEVDIRAACDQLRAVGTPLLLLTYPQPNAHPDLAAGILRAGRRCGITVVDPRGPFRDALDDGVPWSELLIPDGHPTSRGYAMMGGLVVETVLSESLLDR
jgi:tetratricopeptide (TPR) repeat protein